MPFKNSRLLIYIPYCYNLYVGINSHLWQFKKTKQSEKGLFMPDSDCFCFAPILRNLLSLLCKFDDISDAALCHDLIVCIKSKYFMKLISKVSSCIGRLVSCPRDDMQFHFSQCCYDLFCCVFFFQLFFKYSIDHQWQIAD